MTFSARASFVVVAMALLALGCGDDETVDPLDCEVAEHLIPLSAEMSPSASISFRDDWGEAPARMKMRLLRSEPSRFNLVGCGRDQDSRLWELTAGWYQLPEDDPASAEIELFDRERLDAGERLGDEPHFGGNLLRCWEGGCVEVDRFAFHYHYSADTPDYVSGSADIELLDRAEGRFVATVVAKPGSPNEAPVSRIELDLSWDPATLPQPL
jgi:hypothetical protein